MMANRRRFDGKDAGARTQAKDTMATIAVELRRRPVPWRGDWARFGLACTVLVLGVGAAAVFVGLGLAGQAAADTVGLAGRIAATLGVAASCGLLAWRSTGRLRTAWGLIGASSLVAFLSGGLALAIYSGVLRRQVPFPSPADAALLFAELLTLAGVLSFPSSPTRASSRLRIGIDALVIAVSMLYVGWAFGLGGLYTSSHVQGFTASVGLAYPVLDMVTLTALLLVVRRAPRTKYVRLGLLAGGVLLQLIANSAYAVAFAEAGHVVASPWADVAFIAGLGLIALATWAPAGPSRQPIAEAPVTLWRMLLPWTGLVAVMVTVVIHQVTARPFDMFLIYPSVALAALLMASQLVSFRETLGFLTKSQRAEAALQARTQVLNQIITHAPLGVARIGRDNRFIDANPRLGSLLHAPMKILMGAPVSEFVVRHPQADTIAQYRELYAGSLDTVDEEGIVKRADGSTAWVHWTTTAVRKPDGSFDYFLSMAEDVSARHEAEDVAMQNLAGLERLNKMKSEFVSMVSHEFRTALVGIQGFSELIRDEELESADVKGLAGDINNDAQRLNRMISEMLDLDRMEAGKIHLDLKAVDLNGILEDAVQRAQVGADGHRLVADLDVALPVVSGDSDRLIQVVSNLLSNAIKYSPDGGEVRVTSRRVDDSVEVSVQDHGVGIPAEAMNRVFGRYERFDSNRTSKVTGTGLGLAISHQIVELHGGRISVESQAGKGSTFRFTIPVARMTVVPAFTRAVASTA